MLKIFQIFLTTILFSIFAISCNPFGKNVSEEKPLDDQLVNTTENLDLKKGDILVIWGKMDASFLENDNVPVFHLSYNLSLDGKTIENATVPMFSDNEKIINSTYEVQKEEKEEEEQQTENEISEGSNSEQIPEEKPEKITKSDWTFEQEVIQIPIEKDGKYTLDYKANSNSESARSIFTKVAVILRKR